MTRLQREFDRLFSRVSTERTRASGEFPPVNIWTSAAEALLTAEVPGIDPENLEITVKDDTVTIRGNRDLGQLESGQEYLRQERGAGTFVRSFALPFRVESGKVKASYARGILRLALPRHEEEKPKRIAVSAA